MWRERTDVWCGTALVRPDSNSQNAKHGGAYVAFLVVARNIRDATETLCTAVEAQSWELTSLLKMTRASDFENDDSDGQFDDLANRIDAGGIALGTFHAFPEDGQRPQ